MTIQDGGNMFYFISYALKKQDENGVIFYDFCSACIDNHPFNWLNSFSKDENTEKVIILGFKEITKDKYDLFNS